MHILSILPEASYAGNIGAMETAKFFQMASPEQKDKLRELIKAGKTKEGWKLIQRIVGIKLSGREFN